MILLDLDAQECGNLVRLLRRSLAARLGVRDRAEARAVGERDKAVHALTVLETVAKFGRSTKDLSRGFARKQTIALSYVAVCCSKLGRSSSMADGTPRSGREIMGQIVKVAVASDAIIPILTLRLVICLVEEHFIFDAVCLLQDSLRTLIDTLEAVPDQASVVTTMFEIRRYFCLVLYKFHFFGRGDYRGLLVESIRRHTALFKNSSLVLGKRHPITQKILASLILCFDEQLDWSVDDIPAELLEVRPLLDDVPPDIVDRLQGVLDRMRG